MKKVKVLTYLDDDVILFMITKLKGFRGLSSKNRRIRDKRIRQIIPVILTEYFNEQ